MRQLKAQGIAPVSYTHLNNIKPKPQEVGKTEDSQTIGRCRICGYEYVGEELPDDFICPLCCLLYTSFIRRTDIPMFLISLRHAMTD